MIESRFFDHVTVPFSKPAYDWMKLFIDNWITLCEWQRAQSRSIGKKVFSASCVLIAPLSREIWNCAWIAEKPLTVDGINVHGNARAASRKNGILKITATQSNRRERGFRRIFYNWSGKTVDGWNENFLLLSVFFFFWHKRELNKYFRDDSLLI